MDVILRALIVILCAGIIVAFFLPWVNVESQQVGAVSKFLTGKSQEGIAAISGFNIPIMANSEDARFIISIAKTFKPDIKDVDKKSFLVILIPVLALVIMMMTLSFGKSKLFNLLLGLLGVFIFAVAVYKINATDLDKLVMQIEIGIGMWITLFSYLVIGLCGFTKVLVLK